MATIHQDRGTDPQETGQQRSFPTTTVLQILAFLAAMLAVLLFAFWTFVAFLAGLGGGEGSTPGQLEIELLLSLIATLGTLTAAILIVGRFLRVSIALSAACTAAGFILWLAGASLQSAA